MKIKCNKELKIGGMLTPDLMYGEQVYIESKEGDIYNVLPVTLDEEDQERILDNIRLNKEKEFFHLTNFVGEYDYTIDYNFDTDGYYIKILDEL